MSKRKYYKQLDMFKNNKKKNWLSNINERKTRPWDDFFFKSWNKNNNWNQQRIIQVEKKRKRKKPAKIKAK